MKLIARNILTAAQLLVFIDSKIVDDELHIDILFLIFIGGHHCHDVMNKLIYFALKQFLRFILLVKVYC